MKNALILFLLIGLVGCQFPTVTGPSLRDADVSLSSVEDDILEKSRQLNTATVEVLSSNPTLTDDPYGTLAFEYSSANQRLIGYPIKPINVSDSISRQVSGLESELSINRAELEKIKEEVAILRQGLVERQREFNSLQSSLASKGAIYEEQQREKWYKSIWSNASSLVRWALFIAALIFLGPIVLPILGSFIGWIVRALPSLVGFLGVAPKQTLDSVVLAVQNVKNNVSASKKTYTSDEVIEMLNNELRIKTDRADKQAISSRKKALNLV